MEKTSSGSFELSFVCGLLLICANRLANKKIEDTEAQVKQLTSTAQESSYKLQVKSSELRDKEDYILSFAHEMKNLMNVLLGNVSFVLQDAPKVIQTSLKASKVTAEVVRHMLHNILDAGKQIHNSNIEIKPEKVHVPQLLECIWSLCAEIIRSKPQISAVLQMSSQVPSYLRLDPQRLLQILVNLTSNAVKFTQEGQITIMVNWEPISETETAITRPTLASTNDYVGSSCIDPSSFNDFSINEKASFERIEVYETKSVSLSYRQSNYHELSLSQRTWSQNFEESRYRSKTRGILRFTVKDTGSGMSNEQKDKLFGRFSQVSEDQEMRKMGSGLGLWITKQLIDQQKGSIDVSSAIGRGTEFEFQLPTIVEDKAGRTSIEITKDVADSANSISPPKPWNEAGRSAPRRIQLQEIPEQKWASTTSLDTPLQNGDIDLKNFDCFTAANTGAKNKILVADDDAFNTQLLTKFLSDKMGMNTLVAHSGEEVLNIVAEEGLDDIKLVLIDKNLGDRNGLHIIDELRVIAKATGSAHVPCYLVSGETNIEMFEDFEKSDLDGFIPKPIDFKTLERIVVQSVISI